MADTIQEGQNGLTDLSIDEIFTRNSVHSVRNLHREYNASVNKAKADLHSLVGRKYRDLIQIAEDIEKMNGMSKSIDDKLTNLSYRTSNHVLFGSNSFAKFDSKLREENAKSARLASKHTIFNSIVNNQLLAFDLKLQGTSHISSRNLVNMAKVYFTVETVFKTKDADVDLTRKSLEQYKSRFNSYLENKIASELPNLSSFEKLKVTIISSSNSQWLELDAFDLDGSLDEEQEDYSDEEGSGETATKRYFGGSSSPMSNYTVAYIILNESNGNFQSLEQVARKIIGLRFDYLRSLLSSALEKEAGNPWNINFSFIIAFTESTYAYVRKYFLDSGSSNVVVTLVRTSSWKASESIGFHNWFEADNIVLNSKNYVALQADFLNSPESRNNSFMDYLIQIFTDIVTKSNKLDPLKQADRAMSLLHNFVIACRKAEVTAESNDNPSFTIELFALSNLPHRLLKFVVSFIQDLLANEKDFIAGKLLTQIKNNLEDASKLDAFNTDLFERNVINLIDDDFEKYFGQVLASSSSDFNDERGNGTDACDNLKIWFREQKSLLDLILTTDSSLVVDMIQALTKTYTLAKPFQQWGAFDIKVCQSNFLQLSEQRKDSLKSEINKLLDDVRLLLQSFTIDPDMNKLHYILKIVHLLKTNISLYNDEHLVSRIDEALQEIFQRIFDALQTQMLHTSTLSPLDILSRSLVREAKAQSGTVPLWPHLVVNSSIEQISAAILVSSYLSSAELLDIFLCEGNKDLFVKVKNSFITHKLIEERLVEGAKSVLSSESSTEISENIGLSENTEIDQSTDSIESTESTDKIESKENTDTSESADNITKSEDMNESEPTDHSKQPEIADNLENLEGGENTTIAENAEESKVSQGSEVKAEDSKDETDLEKSDTVQSLGAELSNSVEVTQQTPHLIKSQSRQLMANIAFLLCFVSEFPLKVQNEKIAAYVKLVDSLSRELIEESTLDIIVRGANEFYKSTRNIHLPLLLN